MSWVDSWSIELDDFNEQKYWRFIGEEWLWFLLNKEQIAWIEKTAGIRDRYGKTKTKVHYSKGDSLPLNISGLSAELVVSYFTGEKINQIELKSKTAPDIGRDIEVKSTMYSKNWTMYVNESQLIPQRRYVFAMTFLYPKYVALLGWCYGRQFPPQLEEFAWRDKERAYKIGWEYLNNMSTFVRLKDEIQITPNARLQAAAQVSTFAQ